MFATLTPPEVRTRPTLGNEQPPWPFRFDAAATVSLRKTSLFAAAFRSTVLGALGCGALVFVTFSLTPAMLVAMLLFLPALLPFLLVGLAIVLEADLPRAAERRDENESQPCTCHHDRMQRALNGA